VWPQAKVQTCIVHLIRPHCAGSTTRPQTRRRRATRHQRRTHGSGRLPRPRRVGGQEHPPRIPRHHLPLATSLGTHHPVSRLRPRSPSDHLHHEHDRRHQQRITQGHAQPRPLPLRRSTHQSALRRLHKPGPPAWASAMFPKNQTCALVDNRHMRKPITPNQINMIVNIR
jgi:hypothetical protein